MKGVQCLIFKYWFLRYINDVRYQINKADYTANPIRVGLDQTYGAYVEETISFTPTYDKLCGRDYGLESVCGSGNSSNIGQLRSWF